MHDAQRAAGRSFAQTDLFRVRKACLAAALALGLSACGGGGGGDAAGPSASTAGTQPNSSTSAPEPTAGLDAAAGGSNSSEQWVGPDSPIAAAVLPIATDRAPLGVNLEGLSDWARLQPFVDVMKTSRPWGTADAPWDEKAAVDAQGWPTGDAGVVVIIRTIEPGDEAKAYRYVTPGVYKLRFTGRATVTPAASPDVQVRNYAYDQATNKSQAEVVVGSNATQLMLTFRNTVKGVKDVTLRMPNHDDTQMFTKQFIQALQPFQVVRFMDFLRTNDNATVNWSERTWPSSATQAGPKGAAYEYATQVANQLGKDIWINIPAQATDAYIRTLAQLMKLKLAPGRNVYVEYSNELWNYQFSQATYNMNAAVAEAIAGDTTLTKGQRCTQAQFDAYSGECNPYWAGYYRVGKRTVQIARIFSEVFGAAALNKQVRVVYPTQFANPGVAEQVLKNIATYRATPRSLIYGVATAPYFYLSDELAGSATATKDQVLQSLEASLRTEDEPMFAAAVKENGAMVRKPYTGGNYTGASHKALADYYGIKSLAYEGGPDLRQSDANRAVKVAANRDSKMGELVRSELSQWFGCGNDVFMHFSLSSAWDRYGYWGLTNDPADLSGPKYKVASDIAKSARSAYATCR